ncbi:MAG: hypothetical protein QM640_01115 [Niabella sp.]
MKKITVFILTICYLLTTTGVVAISHFCMDKLSSVSFYTTAEKRCAKCGMKKDAHSCCNDKEELLKINTDHFKAPVLAMALPSLDKMPVLITAFLLSPLENSKTDFTSLRHPPPLLPGNDIYLDNNVFRI